MVLDVVRAVNQFPRGGTPAAKMIKLDWYHGRKSGRNNGSSGREQTRPEEVSLTVGLSSGAGGAKRTSLHSYII